MRKALFILLAATMPAHAAVSEKTVSKLPDNRPVKVYTLTHPSGISATVSDLGATLRTLSVPDRDGKTANILVGYTEPGQWLDNASFFGSTVGRYANRIAGGKFPLDGKEYTLAQNNGTNHLHGGKAGFDKVLWKSETTGDHSVKFTYTSPDGEEGYPGTLETTIEYTLAKNSLTWKATAITDKATPVNLTNHAYFNLTGDPAASVLDHLLHIQAKKYLPVDATLIPTGELREVAGTPFDFTNPVTIGANLEKMEGGFDHNFVLSREDRLRLAARASDPASGRTMELFTNQPGIQFYLSSPFGNENSAFCLEPQKFPDSPNQPAFPDSILKPGETYTHEILLNFPDPE